MPDVTTFADEKRSDQVISAETGLSDHASESFGGSEAPGAILGKRHRLFPRQIGQEHDQVPN